MAFIQPSNLSDHSDQDEHLRPSGGQWHLSWAPVDALPRADHTPVKRLRVLLLSLTK